jgi:hypothetical protein
MLRSLLRVKITIVSTSHQDFHSLVQEMTRWLYIPRFTNMPIVELLVQHLFTTLTFINYSLTIPIRLS